MMNRTWFLRNEFYQALHRWPAMILFLALGCAIGWLISWIWPPVYKATSQVYVGLNAYRALNDTRFLAAARPKYSNVDNYHYWQMSQLNAAIFLDKYIEETLKDLRKSDERWKHIRPDELRSMLDAQWRTSGNWDLIAQYSDEEMASQAAAAWSKIAVEQSRSAVNASRDAIYTDQELQSVREAALQAGMRQQLLQKATAALENWQKTILQPVAGQATEQAVPLPADKRWQLLALVTSLAQFNPAWQTILAAQPAPEAPSSAYTTWLEQVKAQIDTEISTLDQQQAGLKDQQGQLEARYTALADSSLGFAPTLEFDGPRQQTTTRLRPTGMLILIGGIVGLLGWVIVQLALITNHSRSLPETSNTTAPLGDSL
jgi:hypothetical protein